MSGDFAGKSKERPECRHPHLNCTVKINSDLQFLKWFDKIYKDILRGNIKG